MKNTLYRLGSSINTPVTPYQPARPAYTSFEQRIGYRAAQNKQWVIWREAIPNTQPTQYTETLVFIVAGQEQYSYTVEVFHPATPEVLGSGGQRVDSPPAGWTSFARSQAFVYPDATMTFKASAGTTGAAVGLSRDPSPRIGYSHIPHGLLAKQGQVFNLSTGALLSTYTGTDELGMTLDAGDISFTKNGVEIGTEASTYSDDQSLFMSAALWGAGDFVDEPELTQIGTPTPAANVIEADAVMAPMRAFASTTPSIQAAAVMAPMRADAYIGLESGGGNTTASAIMAPMRAAALVLVGSVGEAAAVMRPMKALAANGPYTEGRAAFKPMQALAYQEPNDRANMLDGVTYDVPMSGTKGAVFDARERLAYDVPMTGGASGQQFDARERLVYEVPMSGAGQHSTIDVRDSLIYDVVMSAPGADSEVHAVWMDGYGSTTYSGFDFNSFARIGGRYYGANNGGLYLLEGDTDVGAPIRSAICPGKLDMGTSQNKTIIEAWLGVQSDCPMACKLAAEGEEYVYEADSHNCTELEQHRMKFGKGLTANYIVPIFYNQDGADFEIDKLEFAIAVKSRKH